uniref:Uncharacterized protein n=1 Tax=Anguilla anguilla TaxID=7936 RepID=A0A0E9VB24_ANGAN
MWSKAFRTCE